MLYGEGDFDTTVDISTRAGQDSDCNPSTAAGVLGAMMGYEALPEHVREAIAPYMDVKFSHTDYSIEDCLPGGISSLASRTSRRMAARKSTALSSIEVQPFEPPPGPTEVALANLIPTDGFWTTDNRITWEGEWKDLWVKDGLRGSGNAGDYMEVRFPGTAVFVESWVTKDGGILEVTVDGKPMGTRDMYLKMQGRQEAGLERTGQRSLADGSSGRRAHAACHGHRRETPGQRRHRDRARENRLLPRPDRGVTATRSILLFITRKEIDVMRTSQRWMKGAAIIVALASVCAIAGNATAGDGEESPLVGSWTLTISMGAKDFDVMVVVNPDLTGTAEWDWGDEAADLENVVSEGNDASFGCPAILGLEFKGSIDGDTFEGDVTSDYGDGTFTGTRS